MRLILSIILGAALILIVAHFATKAIANAAATVIQAEALRT